MTKLLFALAVLLFTIRSVAQQNDSRLLNVNYEKLVSTASLTYDRPVSRSEEGMYSGRDLLDDGRSSGDDKGIRNSRGRCRAAGSLE